MRSAVVLALALALSGCGMGKAAYQTGQIADKYGCLAKELKGEGRCGPERTPAQ